MFGAIFIKLLSFVSIHSEFRIPTFWHGGSCCFAAATMQGFRLVDTPGIPSKSQAFDGQS